MESLRITRAAVGTERRQAVSYSISSLLTRNLHDVFGEHDPERRRAAIDDIFTEDGVFYDPSKGVYRGRDEIDRGAGAIKATQPDFRYQPIAEAEELGNGGRIQWVSGRPGEAPAYAGTDFIIVLEGQDCRRLSLFRQATLRWTLPCDSPMCRISEVAHLASNQALQPTAGPARND